MADGKKTCADHFEIAEDEPGKHHSALHARIFELEEKNKKLEKERDEAIKTGKTKGRDGWYAGKK